MDFDCDDEQTSRDALTYHLALRGSGFPDYVVTIHGSKSPGHLHAWVRDSSGEADAIKDGEKIHYGGMHVGEYKTTGIVPLYLPEAFGSDKMNPATLESLPARSFAKLFKPPGERIVDTGPLLERLRNAAKGSRRATMKATICRLVANESDATATIEDVIAAYEVAQAGDMRPDQIRRDVEGFHKWARARVKRRTIETFPTNAPGLAAILDHLSIKLRHNERWIQDEILYPESDDWRTFSRRERNRLMTLIESKCRMKKGDNAVPWIIPVARFDQFVDATTEPTDPYLDHVRAITHDGTARIDTLLSRCFDTSANDAALVTWASRQIVMAPILRAHSPGAKVDEMTILVGGQGIGKSTAVAALLPDARFFGDFSLGEVNANGMGHRDLVERLGRFPVAEVAEMGGIRESQMAARRGFLTRTHDSYAPKYEKTLQVPRRFVFIATANPEHSVPDDPTGNRRFVPIHVAPHPEAVDGMHAAQIIEAERDQLLAEGLRRIKAGEAIHLPTELKNTQQAAFEEHRDRDPWEDLKDSMHDRLADFMPAGGYTLFQLAEYMGLTTRATKDRDGLTSYLVDPGQRLPKREQMRLAAVLTAEPNVWEKHATRTGKRWAPEGRDLLRPGPRAGSDWFDYEPDRERDADDIFRKPPI